jgi:hypothetical protein
VFVSVRIAETILSNVVNPGQLAPSPDQLLQPDVDQVDRVE